MGKTRSRHASRSQTDGPGLTRVTHKNLPTKAAAVIKVAKAGMTVGGMPVTATPLPQEDRETSQHLAAVAPSPAAIRIEVADRAHAEAAAIHGVLMSTSRADGSTAAGQVHLRFDYTSFANAYGGDYGNRLRLVQLPACVLTAPSKPECQRQTEIRSLNNGGAVSADVRLTGRGGVPVSSSSDPVGVTALALTAATSSSGSDYSATSLSPSYSWAAGNQSGSFDFNYPMKVPPGVGGPEPELTLGYDSGAVDAQTWAQNGQTSWAGEGWDLQAGYVERSYRSCNLDGGTTPDMCWFSPYNATLVFNGQATMLVRDKTTGVWHGQDDAALKVEQVFDTSKGNGDNDGEYWRVTTQDGTQYYFGVNKRYSTDTAATNSVLTEPVYGNQSGEPCYNATFANASCQQGYRWNLDYVVDPTGNSMTYFYNKFSGYYGHNNNTGVAPYDLAGTLDHIDYGTRAGSEATGNAPMQAWFTRTNRCLNSCGQNTTDYPDTPWDLYCSSTTSCPSLLSPAFFTRYKLSSVYTRVWDSAAAAYHKVDQWDMTYTYPSSGDNISPAGADTSPNLWLQSVTHTGSAPDGTSLAEPAVTFGGTQMYNRVDWGDDVGVPPYVHYRLTSIVNGTGGQTLISYSTSDCSRAYPPVPYANPYRCFPVYFAPKQAPAGWGWFNKYVVTSVTNRDLTGGSPDEVSSYTYSTAGSSDEALWHHDYNEMSTLAYRSWSQWRGYSTVTVTHGASGGPQTVTTNLSYRGMDGDGIASADNQSVVWNTRRVGLLTPLGTPGATTAIAGTGFKCLDISRNATADGTNIQVWSCTGATNQVWQRQFDANGRPIMVNPATGKCLDLSAYGTTNGTNVQLWTCTGATNQVWERQPNGTLKNPVSGRCLDTNLSGTVDGTNVQLYDCSSGTSINFAQVWQPRNTGALAVAQAGRCVDLSGYGTANGTKVQSWGCTGVTNQAWQLRADGTLLNPVSGRCLDVVGAGTANGTKVQLYDCSGGVGQVWVPQSDGTLKNPHAGRCLNTAGSNTAANGTQLEIDDCGTLVTEKWQARLLDADGSQGFERQADSIDGSTVVESTINTPMVTLTATRATPATGGQDINAYLVSDTEEQTRTWLSVSSAYRWTDRQTSYDSYGLPTDVKDLGDISTSADDLCDHTDYARNTAGAHYLVDFPSQDVVTDCAATPGDADYLSGTQTLYDGSATVGAAPSQGLETRVNDLASISAGTKSWAPKSRTEYDPNGRVTATYDPLDHKTGMAYTPVTGGPVTSTQQTNPLGWITTVTLNPGDGSVTATTDANGKTTSLLYDPLGRLSKVWANNRPTTATPDLQYTYTLSASSPNWVRTQSLGPTGAQITSYAIFDGQMRQRQSQVPAPVATGGRMISDTTYDGRGLKAKSSTFYNASSPASTLVTFADTDVPSQEKDTYDALERQVVSAFLSQGTQLWQTTTTYQGDRVAVTPPTGGTTVQRLYDARGNATQLRQFTTPNTSGSYQTTNYTYDRQQQLIGAQDAAGSAWSWTYDMRGRQTAKTDPDAGASSNTYDDAGELLTSTDARGVTLAYKYDELGRKTEQWHGSTTAPGYLLASWAYDSIAKGQPASSTRWHGGDAYTITVTGYDDAYRPLGQTVTIPTSQGSALGGDWTTLVTYNVDGSLASTAYPAAGGQGTETVNYGYDANGYALTADGQDAYVSATNYHPWGDVYQRTLGAGSKRVQVTTDEFPDTHRIKTISTATESATTPGTFDEQLTQRYNWTPAGTITSIDNQHAGATTDSQCFTYDFLQRLSEAFTTTPSLGGCAVTPSTSTVGGPDAYWQTYTYDVTGNRKTLVSHDLGGTSDTSTTYTYPAPAAAQAHTLSGSSTTGPTGPGTSSYTYDADGQQTNSTVNGLSTDFTWEDFNQIATANTHAAGGDQSTAYIYDADGTELLRVGPTSRTLYLGYAEITTDATGGTVTAATRYYSCGGTVVASRASDGSLTWLANDHQGTAAVAVDATTLSTRTRKQDPFGNARSTPPNWPNDRGFVGGTTEPAGLVHLGARQYDPTTGRFISIDPLFDTDDPTGWNGYSYADNNPVAKSDPSGLTPCLPGEPCGAYKPGCESCNQKAKHSHNYPCWPAKSCKDKVKNPAHGHHKIKGDGGKKPKPPVKKREEDKPAPHQEKKTSGTAQVGWWAGAIAGVVGLIPGFLCTWCAAISMFFSLVSAVAYLIAMIRDCTCYVGDFIGAVAGLGAAWGLGKLGQKGVEAMVKGAGGALQYLARHAASVEHGVVTVLPKLVPSRIAIQAGWIMHGVTTMISTAYGYIATYHTQSVYTNNHPWEGAATEGTGVGIS
ncbi:ricin-type beta-trefoil lectin domain protein [Micromonospora sp. CA-244673]|uniref:ricin-type beta-trefoil lectin domain protein n=1 Tax=Micromonospora sp. CA-244673 TaxID=3239958 RepID=UPI003D8D270D